MSWNNYSKTTRPKFRLGVVLFTPGIHQLVEEDIIDVLPLIYRHSQGDWGDMDDEDKQTNDEALRTGFRLFSAYEVPPHYRVWIITEADRSTTTLLLPDEY